MGQDGRHGTGAPGHLAGPLLRPRRGGRPAVPGPHRDRHVQLRHRRRSGGAQGGRARRRAARRGRHRGRDHRGPAGAGQRRGALGRRRRPGTPAAPRPPRRRTRRGVGLAGRPVRRRDQGRPGLGPRRGRHEGLRRDAAQRRTRPRGGRRGPGPRGGALLHRRRGGGRGPRREDPRRAARRLVRRLHRGRRRGRRVLGDRAWTPGLPDRGRREGDGLDAPHRARAGRATAR